MKLANGFSLFDECLDRDAFSDEECDFEERDSESDEDEEDEEEDDEVYENESSYSKFIFGIAISWFNCYCFIDDLFRLEVSWEDDEEESSMHGEIGYSIIDSGIFGLFSSNNSID